VKKGRRGVLAAIWRETAFLNPALTPIRRRISPECEVGKALAFGDRHCDCPPEKEEGSFRENPFPRRF
jgi:hypothetical protein